MWVGLVAPAGEGFWSLLPLGLDLYDGQPGVLLFLAYLGALTGVSRYTSLDAHTSWGETPGSAVERRGRPHGGGRDREYPSERSEFVAFPTESKPQG